MIPVLSREQMRAFDAHAIDACRVPSVVLMENAGRGAADVIEREIFGGSARGRRVVVVSGAGNNGGDGFVVARHLLARGARVEAWLAADLAKATPDCRANHDAFGGIGGAIVALPLGVGLKVFAAAVAGAELVIDALFGTGLDRPIKEPLAGVVRVLNETRARQGGRLRVVALDVPSGLDADTGRSVEGVEADLTVTFAHLKLGHMTPQGARKTGPVRVVDIGVPPDLKTERSAELVEAADVRALVGARALDTHKYRAGHVALLAGSEGKLGAALLAARGALRGGAGAATIVTWPEVASGLESRVTEVMVARLLPSADEGDDEALARSIDAALDHKRAVVLGPGFGTGARAAFASRHVLGSFTHTIVADADAFSIHAGAPADFTAARGRAILTPHSGELARLLGTTSDEIESDRFGAARRAAQRANAVVLLKGAYTVVASPDGRVVVTAAGSPVLATAGSGDVLSGLIGALACTLPPFEAAYAGAWLHGRSGSVWSEAHGDRGLLAHEIADGLPAVLQALHG